MENKCNESGHKVYIDFMTTRVGNSEEEAVYNFIKGFKEVLEVLNKEDWENMTEDYFLENMIGCHNLFSIELSE